MVLFYDTIVKRKMPKYRFVVVRVVCGEKIQNRKEKVKKEKQIF